MAKYKPYSYSQTVMIPLDFNKQILPGTFEYTLNYLVDNRIDLSIFEAKYNNDETGAPAWNPAVMLKIIIFGYSKGIISSRGLAEACQDNIIFKALSANSEPHFTTIASFISKMKDEITPIFRNVLLVCSELDLVGGDMFALDGCKISSNASKEWSGTFKDLEKKKDKFEKMAQFLIEKHQLNDENDMKNNLDKKKVIKQVEKIKQKADKIERFLRESKPKPGKRTGEVQSNITDNQSAKMKSNKGIIQGYNGLAISDSENQVIIYAETFGSGQEGELLKPMVEGTNQIMMELGKSPDYLKNKKFLADTNYFSEANLKYLAEKEIDATIPDNQFRQRDPRFQDQARHKPEKKGLYHQKDFIYNEDNNEYICPGGKVISFYCYRKLGNTSGRIYQAKQADCSQCDKREFCLQIKKARRRTLYVIDHFNDRNYSELMKQKIDTPNGRQLYSQRMRIIEPVFANITYSKKMNRFNLRTKVKVNIQWQLYCIVHNIGKIACSGGLIM